MKNSNKPRGLLIAGNWKMNLGTVSECRRFFGDLVSVGGLEVSSALNGSLPLRAAIYPPFVTLLAAKEASEKTRLKFTIGAQNAHGEKNGAFTGEISGPMLQDLGIHSVLVGHSERRQYFGETDASCRKRTEGLLSQGFEIILCLGETLQEREAGQTEQVLKRQLLSVIGDRSADTTEYPARAALYGRLILAYEPVWAIGTGHTATPDQAQAAHAFLRRCIDQAVGANAAEKTPILYGGSVTPTTIEPLLACPDVDGVLVGSASLKAESFCSLLLSGAKILQQASAP